MTTFDQDMRELSNDEIDTWQEMLRSARALPLREIQRHALVSIRNRHSCRSCFTCACAVTLRQLDEARLGLWEDEKNFPATL